MAFGRAILGPEEQNRLIDAGLAKANQVLFGTAKATTTDAGNFRMTQFGPGGVGVISGLNQETKNADALNAAQLATARLTNVKADVLPAESQATVNETAARAGLIQEQTKVVVPNSQAQNAAQNAAARLTGAQADVLNLNGGAIPALDSVAKRARREARMLSQIDPAQAPFFRLSDDGLSLVPKTVGR